QRRGFLVAIVVGQPLPKPLVALAPTILQGAPSFSPQNTFVGRDQIINRKKDSVWHAQMDFNRFDFWRGRLQRRSREGSQQRRARGKHASGRQIIADKASLAEGGCESS